jgi:hypothetical protein
MKHGFLLLILALFMTSCATLINKQEYPLEIRSNAMDSKVQLNDSIYELPGKLILSYRYPIIINKNVLQSDME